MKQPTHATTSTQTAEQPLPTESPEGQLLNQSNQLLENALSSCNIPGFTPVQMAFPSAISGKQINSSDSYSMNIQQLFAQQAQLFNPPTETPEAPVTVGSEQPEQASNNEATVAETEELQAIRAMFDCN